MTATPSAIRTKKKRVTDRERALDILRQHPDGLSKSKLHEALGNNKGAFRRLMDSMEEKGEITVTEVNTPNWGPTKFVRASA